jgi:hypothetical protein
MYQSSMKTVRKQALLLVMAGLFLLAGCSTVEAPPELSTLAKPEKETFHFSNDFVIDVCGDFPLRIQEKGTVKIIEFFDRHGNFVRDQIHINGAGTLTNQDTGKTAFFSFHYMDALHEVNGTLMFIGLPMKVRLPGKGVVVLDAGRLVLDLETDEVIFEAGPHPFFYEGIALICEALR